jgi:hypothetical protein
VEPEKKTAYYTLTSALGELFGHNIFSLFLSTNSGLINFAPEKDYFASARSLEEEGDLQLPFTELPFDLCDAKTPLASEKQHTLDTICTTKFMAQFGRPL